MNKFATVLCVAMVVGCAQPQYDKWVQTDANTWVYRVKPRWTNVGSLCLAALGGFLIGLAVGHAVGRNQESTP